MRSFIKKINNNKIVFILTRVTIRVQSTERNEQKTDIENIFYDTCLT